MFGSKVIDEVELNKERAVRFHYDEKEKAKPMYQTQRPGRIDASIPCGRSFGRSRVFPECHQSWQKQIVDPGSHVMLIWNRAFLAACLVAFFIDPFFFYLPLIEHQTDYSCVKMDRRLNITITCVRSLVDLFYILHIIVKFHTAFVAPSSRVFGRGELVTDPREIGRRYMRSEFFIDFAAALPVPQIVIWLVMPAIRNHDVNHKYTALPLIILIQYILRLYLIFLLSNQIIKSAGVVTKTAWAGAAYNLLLFILASHVLGAVYYLLSISRQITCWKSECQMENMNGTTCDLKFLDCDISNWRARQLWATQTNVFSNCNANNQSITFNYGIFSGSLNNDVVSTGFIEKYFYCLWWGLQNLSSYGQPLIPSAFIGETTFGIFIVLVGLVLFAQLIGNMQTYLQSITRRVEEWRLKQRDTEEWMNHRQLPHELQGRVRGFVQYKWLATRGVDEESILQALPADLHREIRRHLSLDLVRRVPFFSEMDDQLLDAICLRLVSCLSTKGTCIVREGDPVTEMVFIIRGRLESSTTDGGRTGFFNSIILRPGDFCGEELLTWALLPKSKANLPSSTRTVRALVEVEAFVLRAEDLKFVANQFKRLHSKKLQHTFRFHSHHWRTWAACFIQAAWHRYKTRKMAKDLNRWESFSSIADDYEQATNEAGQEDEFFSSSVNPSHTVKNLEALKSASNLAASFRKSQAVKAIDMATKFLKPSEPDFSADPYD
ncbi:cyclic nucleotide-gated ion channel 17 isoform X1 [Elaeis guineensis]|uniref:Cyclic nucleotide-gated ion channel 17 n=1 Tax=Elaeis guineensis var. tenera TaxID=51953 RepID=A0A6I9QRA7_ELAGV|nr:cyclic nucleotide-gated ion channel 17 [Elaeis guineensis]